MHTIRSRPPLSSSFNQPSCLFNNTYERNPLLISSPLSPKCSCSCCCCCYAANISMHDRLVSENPSFLCKGLSQSVLIQWSLCKRLIFHGGIRQSYGNTYGFLSFDDLDESYCYEKLRSFKKKRQFLSNVNDDCVNDGEVMLSLLTDEVDSEYSDVKNREKIDFEVIKMKSLKKSKNLEWRKEDSFGGLDGNKDCEVKSDGYYVGQTSSSKNDLGKDCKGCIDEVAKMKSLKKSKNLDLRREDSFGGLEGNQDFKVKSDGYYVGQTSSSSYKKYLGKDCIDEVIKMKSLKKSKNLDLRREDSFGGLESNQDFEVKSDGYFVGQMSSSAYKNDLGKDYKGCVDEVVGTIEKRQDPVQELEGLLGKNSVNGCYGDSLGVSQNWRKKSEKKLNKELSQHESNISVNIEPCKQHSHEMFRITDEPGSRMKYKQLIEMSDKDKSVIESTSITENKLKVIPKLQDIHMRVTSSLPESRIKSFKERSTEVNAMVIKPTSIQDNKDGGSRHSSQGSGPKGPSDEMWHVTDASTQEPSEPDNTYGSSENDEPVKTSGRSLWTTIGDMVRVHWKSSQSGSHTPTSGCETWFSSHEPDDPNDENVRKRIIKGLDSPIPEGPSRNTSLPMIKESTFLLKRSPDIKKMVKTGPDHLTELKRRNLVHKDQIFKDNFDEWEEIYNLEKKQLKEDEIFMREALLEAKKAADVWEVPVGAVLVKDGKIVARGYNMVEELQDSTAHAEMICIRKASTNISSWRLSDSTLYVTLEPCPMCAGAILQARIHTVVWGAPNKLLGADGSWIRLFCDGDGGSSSMTTAITPAHPFHPNMAVRRGVLAAECGEVMQHFFQLRRKKKTEPQPPNPPSSISVSHHHSNFLSKIHHAFNAIFCL